LTDVVGAQRAVAELVLDPEARAAWRADPAGWASGLDPDVAAMIARLDPAGLEAMAASHAVKKDRFDELHKRHHDYEDAKAARRAAHDHDHGHDHPHDHDHGHPHDHGSPG